MSVTIILVLAIMESNAQAPITVNVFVENVIATQNGTAQVFWLEDK